MTSHDVVDRIRRLIGERSVGHLGTLDPSATGVLPMVLGRFTRLSQFYTNADKRYEGIIQFGFSTDTYDAEGEPQGPKKPVDLSLEQIQEAARTFVGEIEQVPPPFSAKKIGGVPAYKFARKKHEVELKPRPVEVKEFEILDWNGEQAHFRVWVSSGTYIRSLAHELGKMLGPGAHLASLERTAVREFGIAEAHSLEELEAASRGVNPDSHQPQQARQPEPSDSPHPQRLITNNLVNPEQIMDPQRTVGFDVFDPNIQRIKALSSEKAILQLCLAERAILPELPAIVAVGDVNARLKHGRGVNLPCFGKEPLVRVFDPPDRLLAIAKRIAGTLFHPKVVLR
jgi:tRNA pseudouridine55 synthase